MITLEEPELQLWRRFETGALTASDRETVPVLERWSRARALDATRARSVAEPPASGAPALRGRNRTPTLLTCARDVLDGALADLRRRGLALLLADENGVILMSRGVELFDDARLRALLVEGLDLSETACGTNAIGTALAEQGAIAVIGRAHYETVLHQLCCYAAPIRDATNRIIGVLDLSGPREMADSLFGTVVESLAAALESAHRAGESVRAQVRDDEREPRPIEEPSRHGKQVLTASSASRTVANDAYVWQQASREIELTLSPILRTLPVAVWVADAGGNIVLSNAAARRLWGGEIRVALEQYDRFKAWWPDGRRVASEEWGLPRALRTGQVVVDEEMTIETFDGFHKIIRNSAAPIVDQNGRIVGGVAVNEDITSLKRAEATRDLFVGILGHDLRSPLSAIAMGARLLQQNDAQSVEQIRIAQRIQSSTSRIQRLVDSLLDFTRARFAMGLPINPVPVDMSDIIASVVDEMRTAHPHRVIQLARRGDLAGVWDPGRAAQVVSNLVGNAVQHGSDPIVVAADGDDEFVLVSVGNGGQPIAQAKMASLFEPFRKGEGSKGVGLGLFIAREIVRSHGGTIDVRSTETATTFSTCWPRTVR